MSAFDEILVRVFLECQVYVLQMKKVDLALGGRCRSSAIICLGIAILAI